MEEGPAAADNPLARWAVDNELITSDVNLLRFLTAAGWQTLEEMREFCEQDMPADVPMRYRNRILVAVRKLRNEEEPTKAPAEQQEPVVVVHHHYHQVQSSASMRLSDDLLFQFLGRRRLGYF